MAEFILAYLTLLFVGFGFILILAILFHYLGFEIYVMVAKTQKKARIRELEKLYSTLQNVTDKAGIKQKIYVFIHSTRFIPHIASICQLPLGRCVIQMGYGTALLSDQAITGILAHEIGHLKAGHLKLMRTLFPRNTEFNEWEANSYALEWVDISALCAAYLEATKQSAAETLLNLQVANIMCELRKLRQAKSIPAIPA